MNDFSDKSNKRYIYIYIYIYICIYIYIYIYILTIRALSFTVNGRFSHSYTLIPFLYNSLNWLN